MNSDQIEVMNLLDQGVDLQAKVKVTLTERGKVRFRDRYAERCHISRASADEAMVMNYDFDDIHIMVFTELVGVVNRHEGSETIIVPGTLAPISAHEYLTRTS